MVKPEINEARLLRKKQRDKKTDEIEKVPGSITEHEEHQHRRRADKAAYLEEKLAERERAERERD